ncbi:MAG: hypothetical protein HPY80_10810 [Bacteroidales bacterium]|nr:hypothetical protein [Bacteroidales bacterium]
MKKASDILQLGSHKIAFLALTVSGILALLPALLIHKLGTEGDVFTHYYISLQAWKNPLLILDLWGRPLFTLTTMPFALAGFYWLKVYTVFLGILTAWLAYLTVRKLSFTEAWVAIPLVIFTPIFYYLLFNPLTETLMAFLLVWSIYLFAEKKYDLSAIVAGFIPFARLEAFVILPVFVAVFLIKKKYRPIVLLMGGYVLFGLIGYFIWGEFFWFVSKNPYAGEATELYGKGELFHFIKKTDSILGYPLAILALVGTLFWGYRILQMRRSWKKMADDFSVWLLIAGAYMAYLSAHSYSWWSGKGNSLGLVRVMGAVTPLAAIMAVAGLHHIGMELGKIKISDRLLAIGAAIIVALPTLQKHFNYHPSAEEIELRRSVEWLKNNNLLDRKIYYFHPMVGILTNRGAFEDEKGAMKVHFAGFQADQVTPEALVIWDAHFGPNEGQTSLESLLENPSFKLLTEITPEIPFKTLGGKDFKICIFEKDKDFKITGEADSTLHWFVIRKEGFEKPDEKSRKKIDSTQVHTGKYSRLMSEKEEFLEFLNSPVQTLDLKNTDSTLRAGVWINYEPVDSEIAALVAELKTKEKYKYISAPLSNATIKQNGWHYLEVSLDIKSADAEGNVKVYIWNKEKKTLRADDFILGYGMRMP